MPNRDINFRTRVCTLPHGSEYLIADNPLASNQRFANIFYDKTIHQECETCTELQFELMNTENKLERKRIKKKLEEQKKVEFGVHPYIYDPCRRSMLTKDDSEWRIKLYDIEQCANTNFIEKLIESKAMKRACVKSCIEYSKLVEMLYQFKICLLYDREKNTIDIGGPWLLEVSLIAQIPSEIIRAPYKVPSEDEIEESINSTANTTVTQLFSD